MLSEVKSAEIPWTPLLGSGNMSQRLFPGQFPLAWSRTVFPFQSRWFRWVYLIHRCFCNSPLPCDVRKTQDRTGSQLKPGIQNLWINSDTWSWDFIQQAVSLLPKTVLVSAIRLSISLICRMLLFTLAVHSVPLNSPLWEEKWKLAAFPNIMRCNNQTMEKEILAAQGS